MKQQTENEQLLEALTLLFEDYQDQLGEAICDCRPEPENEGHVCTICKVKFALERASKLPLHDPNWFNTSVNP